MSNYRILVVEDEASLVRGLKDSFSAKGFEVITAMEGETGLALALSSHADIVLLDIMLPKVNGYELCREVRAAGLEMPIIILSAKGQEQDIVLGLNLGADDYVTKPFRLRELMARVNAFLRRSQMKQTSSCSFGDYKLDLSSHTLFRSGKEVRLTTKEFDLLAYFVARSGRALTRQDILNRVWGNSVMVTQRSVDRCVTTLRSKIEIDPASPTFIKTIRDIGYRFEAEVEEG